MSPVISKIPDKLEPSDEELELVETEAESSKLPSPVKLPFKTHEFRTSFEKN